MRQLIILESGSNEKRVAVLREHVPIAFFRETIEATEKVDELVLTRIVNFVPGLGYFVSLPSGEKGLLPKSEWPLIQGEASRPFESLHPGESLILQIKRPAVSNKKAIMTRNLKISGEAMIYLPYGNYVAVSRKLAEEETSKLKTKYSGLLKPPEGIIFRTNSLQRAQTELLQEWERLRKKWESIKKYASDCKPPAKLVPTRLFSEALRVMLPSTINREWYTNDPEEFKSLIEAKEPVNLIEKESLFNHYNLEKEWKRAQQPVVYLKSGLSIVIQPTEALTAIDVNTGTFKGKSSKDQTAFEANLEVLPEIVRQLQLRQIGGIILIDLLRMESEEDRHAILKNFKTLLEDDLATTFVAGFTNLGLLELTRKKMGYGPEF